MSSKKDASNRIEILAKIFVLIVILSILFGWSNDFTTKLTNIIIAIMVSTIISYTVGSVIERFSGDLLKKISLNFEIKGYKFSITAFVIVV